MRRTQYLIQDILERQPETRNDDIKLIIAVWRRQGAVISPDLADFLLHKAIHPETITRMRRKLQEAGKYKASAAVEQARYDKFTDMKGYGSTSPEAIQDTLF